MTSKDDDTLPLPGFSQELSVDATVDEDFIPTSQPHSAGSSKMSRNSETSYNKSTEEGTVSNTDSRIDDTLPPEAVMNQSTLDRDKSADFIPDTETKKPIISYGNSDPTCRKKLAVFGNEDVFKVESNQPLWEANESKVPESPALEAENISILNDTPTRILPANQETVERCEESLTEIVVDDSAETVDLETTPVIIKTSQEEKTVERLETSNSSNGETQALDNSSVLLLDQPETDRSDLDRTDPVSETPEKSYHHDAVDDKVSLSEKKTNTVEPQYGPGADVPENCKMPEKVVESRALIVPKQEVQSNPVCTEPNNSSLVTRKLEVKLTVSCLITVNPKTNKVLQKMITNVIETPKPKPRHEESLSDTTSDKSKRQSSSSSGSVYSDKMGPFAILKRVSAVSDQTDSSEEDLGMMAIRSRRASERVPWRNEYLLSLKMDDILQSTVENKEFMRRSNIVSSPKKFKSKLCNGINNLREILESSSSENTSNLVSEESRSFRTSPSRKTTPESSEPIQREDEQDEKPEGDEEKENDANDGEEENSKEIAPVTKSVPKPDSKQEEMRISSVELRDGLAVFARWTDKRYYSGALCGSVKNDRWEVKFDDGTLKAVREDLIMPAEWLNVGSLVFASRDDKYESGQIVDVQKGYDREEVKFVVELDYGKRKISVKISDLCLTDVMAGIVREKYKPLSGTPRGTADIDFDNVLSGKRLREQKTPLRPTVRASTGSSGAKKKSSSKSKTSSLRSIKEDSANRTGKKMAGLKSENGHLVEDKVISADSPSGTEAMETPQRRAAKEGRKRAKPRSLSYEAEETKPGKTKGKSWLAPDGTPIPGPSGVNLKRQKTKGKETEGKSPSLKTGPTTTEKGKRKRKPDEFAEDGARKKSLKEEDNRVRTRNRKG